MPPTLTRAEASALAKADREYWKTKAAFETAKDARAGLLEKHAAKLPAGEWIEAFGKLFRRSTRTTGERFSLKDFRDAGLKVTKHMARFVSAARPYDVLDVRDT